jgi:hypothetical protein
MLGMGDMQGLVEHAQEMALADPSRQENLIKKLEKGEFSVRDLKDQLATIMGMYVARSSSWSRGRRRELTAVFVRRSLAGDLCRNSRR